jgi:hypothetical protein
MMKKISTTRKVLAVVLGSLAGTVAVVCFRYFVYGTEGLVDRAIFYFISGGLFLWYIVFKKPHILHKD